MKNRIQTFRVLANHNAVKEAVPGPWPRSTRWACTQQGWGSSAQRFHLRIYFSFRFSSLWLMLTEPNKSGIHQLKV